MINSLMDFCKDHYKHFHCFPMEFATFNEYGEEDKIYKIPDYLHFLSDSQINEIILEKN